MSRNLAARTLAVLRNNTIVASVAALAVLAASATPSYASSQNGTITSVAFTSGRILFWMSGTRTTKPACDCCGRWEVSVADANGQALMSIIMTAYAEGKAVNLTGTGSCVTGANDTEGVSYIQTF